jgi:hypothetical protein
MDVLQGADLNFRWLAINEAAANEFDRIFGLRPIRASHLKRIGLRGSRFQGKTGSRRAPT